LYFLGRQAAARVKVREVNKMRRRKGRCGQSTLEYLLIITGLIAAIILAKGYVQNKMNTALNRAGDKIVEETDTLMDRVGN